MEKGGPVADRGTIDHSGRATDMMLGQSLLGTMNPSSMKHRLATCVVVCFPQLGKECAMA